MPISRYASHFKNEYMRRTIPVLLMLLMLCSCAPEGGGEGHTVIAALRGPSSVAMLQLIDSLSDAPDPAFEVRIFDEPLQVRRMMLDGTADFAVLPTTMAALLYNRGMDYRLAAVPLWGTLYLCGEYTPASLKGERIHLMARGMTPDVMFRHLLVRNGLDPEKDVTLDYRFPTHIDLANAAIAGRAPLCVLSEPYLSLALKSNPKLRIISDLSAEWNEYESVPLAETALVVRGPFAEGSSEQVEAFVQAYARSGEWVKSHSAEAAALAVKYGILPDEEAAQASVPRSHIDVVPSREAYEAVKAYLNVFNEMDSRIIGEKMPDEEFYLK